MTTLFKTLIVTLLAFIIFNLVKAMKTMLNPEDTKQPMSSYIGKRLKYSVLLIVLLLVMLGLGLIQPNPRPY